MVLTAGKNAGWGTTVRQIELVSLAYQLSDRNGDAGRVALL